MISPGKYPVKGETLEVVGARGFEPPTTCTPCRYATRLRYAPRLLILPCCGLLPLELLQHFTQLALDGRDVGAVAPGGGSGLAQAGIGLFLGDGD